MIKVWEFLKEIARRKVSVRFIGVKTIATYHDSLIDHDRISPDPRQKNSTACR